MMEPTGYIFAIDAFTPDTLPMKRLAEYLAQLAALLGSSEHTHFVEIRPGSAQLAYKVDPVDAPKVEARLSSIAIGTPPKDVERAKAVLETMLVDDNALAAMREERSGRVVVLFVGRNRPKPLVFPTFRETCSIDGQIVSIGSRDATAHAILQDGERIRTNIEMPRETARKLSPMLYGPPVRLHGSGRFERQPDGVWKMLEFRVERFEVLSERPLGETLEAIRAVPGNGLLAQGAYREIADRNRDEGHTA